LNTDQTKIYTIFDYDGLIFFYTILVFDGSITGTTYKGYSNIPMGKRARIQQKGDYLYLLFGTSSAMYLVKYNPSTQAFINYYESTNTLNYFNLCDFVISDSAIKLYGQIQPSVSDLYMWWSGKTFDTSFSANVDYRLVSDSVSPMTVTNYPMATFTSLTETPATLGVNTTYSYKSDTSYLTDDSTIYYLAENESYNYTVEVLCSVGGGGGITYSLAQNGVYPIPNWVAIDSSTALLSINTPTVDEDILFSFLVRSTEDGKDFDQTMNLIVQDCQVSNCKTWKTYFSNVWLAWNDPYSVSEDGSTWISLSTETVKTLAQGAAAVGAATGTAISITSSSSQGMWSSANQYQMLMLLPLTGAYVPEEVLFFLEGFNFAMLSFDFIPSLPIEGVHNTEELMSWDEESEYLSAIGVQTKWIIVNYVKSFMMIIYLITFHLTLLALYSLSKNCHRYIK
jgi:hypothetical protein